MAEHDAFKSSVEAAMPNNTVVYDDIGDPSVMVRIPKFKICDVIDGGSDAVHPAFIVNGKEIPEFLVSKYSNIVMNSRAYSLPFRNPASEVAREAAKEACERKGKGWHLMSNAEWAAIALWCKKSGFMPRGNNSFAKDYYCPHERGYVTYTYEKNGEKREGKTATGSGPVTWAHDGSPAGIYDMNGNVWAQVSGLRLVEGEIQIIPNNDSAAGADESGNSPLWKALLSDGNLVPPGSDGTLKMDDVAGQLTIRTKVSAKEDKWAGTVFGKLACAEKAPEILKALALFPESNVAYGEQKLWINTTGERFPWRGGTWDAFANSGIFCLFMCYPRAHVSPWMGFRSAYVES